MQAVESLKMIQSEDFWLTLKISNRLHSQRVTQKKSPITRRKTGCHTIAHLKKKSPRKKRRICGSSKKRKNF